MAHTVCSCFLALIFASAAAAYEREVDAVAVLRAIAIGQSQVESDRARFHQPYRLAVNRPPVDSVEVVTPFRRVVLAAEAQARLGNRVFTQREALAIVSEAAGRLDVIAETTFHPLNTYVAVPAYQVALVPSGSTSAAILPTLVDRVPRYALGAVGRAPRGPQAPGTGEPLVGGTVTASFGASSLNPAGIYDVVVIEAGKELARTRVDLRPLR